MPAASVGRARALASGAAQLAARCSNTGAARLPERSRSRDSSAPTPAVPAATAVTAVIRALRPAASRLTASASAVGRMCGLALLLRDRLARLMRRPLAWAGIALVNLSAMTLFLWHQTAFIAVSSVGLLAGRVPGLLTAPTGALWVAERLAWLPVFAITLSGLWLAFRQVETPS